MMNIYIYIILGIVQGFTEPLPISSSGHLLIFQELLGVKSLGISFGAFVNFGSTIAIFIYFRKKIWKLIVEGFGFIINFFKYVINNNDKKSKFKVKKYYSSFDYGMKVIVATIPLVIAGIVVIILDIKSVENIKLVGISLIITAISLYLVSKISGQKNLKEISYVDCLIIGVFQVFALMPGISRSGMSLVGALFIGLKNDEAFEFVFMLYIPASIGALIFSVKDLIADGNLTKYLPEYVVTFVFAGVFTYIGLLLLRKLVVTNKLVYFSIYCLIVGTLVIIFM